MCETERQAKMELIEFERFVEQDDCDKYNMLQQSACEIRSLENKNQQLEEKYEELQEAFKKAITTEHHKIHALLDIIDETKTAVDYMIGNVDISEIHGTKLKQILDKVSDSDE